jgi:hypothetical protein
MGLMVFGVMYWIPLTKDSNKWQGLVNLAMNIQVLYRARNLAIRVTVKVSKDSVPMMANKSHGGTSLTTGRLLVLVYVLTAFSVTKYHVQLHCICSGLSHFESNEIYTVIH